MRVRGAIVAIIVLMATGALVRGDDAESAGREALRRLAAAYSDCPGMEVELTPRSAGGAPTKERTRVVVLPDGRFAYQEIDRPEPRVARSPGIPIRDAAGRATGEEIRYFVFCDLRQLFTTDGDAGLYFKAELREDPLSLPPKPQYDLAPWSVVAALAERVLAIEGAAYALDGGEWSVRVPLAERRSFILRWSDGAARLNAIERASPEGGTITRYSEHSTEIDAGGHSWAIARRQMQSASFTAANGERRNVTSDRTLRVLAFGTPDLEQRVAFDPTNGGRDQLRYLDTRTTNVHEREGGAIMYNLDEVNAAFERERMGASALGRTWFGGVIAGALGSLYLLWRKWRGPGGGGGA